MNRWHIFFLTLLVFGSAWVWLSRVPEAVLARGPQPAVGYPAPNFTLTTLSGETVTLADLRGTPVVLNFWATWCDPCRRELPALQATAVSYGEQVVILGVDQAESASTVAEFIPQFGLTYPILLDEEAALWEMYHLQGIPTTFFIDGDGVIRRLWIGEMNRITLAEGIATID